jgi:hypothetical protein
MSPVLYRLSYPDMQTASTRIDLPKQLPRRSFNIIHYYALGKTSFVCVVVVLSSLSAPLAQLVERSLHTGEATGSSPVGCTLKKAARHSQRMTGKPLEERPTAQPRRRANRTVCNQFHDVTTKSRARIIAMMNPEPPPWNTCQRTRLPFYYTPDRHACNYKNRDPCRGFHSHLLPTRLLPSLLRGSDSHRDLKVMSLANYCYSTPLYTALVPKNESVRKAHSTSNTEQIKPLPSANRTPTAS